MFRKLTETTSSISRGVTVAGEIFGDGTVQLFGRIKGEVRASTVLVNEGAEVEGDLVAEELIIAGRVKGTIRATTVKLAATAVVQGDIFHRSLSIDPNARFEGLSKREDDATATSRPGKSSLGSQAPARAGDGVLARAATLRKPAARDVSLSIAEAPPARGRPSPDEENGTSSEAIDRVQRALNVVAALGGGSLLADLPVAAPAAGEPRSKNGSASPSPIPSPSAVPSEPEPDKAD
jgi:cytoskeletal protein CcmA (bactofilin family)